MPNSVGATAVPSFLEVKNKPLDPIAKSEQILHEGQLLSEVIPTTIGYAQDAVAASVAAQGYQAQSALDAAAAQVGTPNRPTVRAATTDALPTFTYSNGAAGVGATITATANGAFPTLDAQTLSVGDRFLHWGTTADPSHGVYTLTSAGSGGTPWVATRAVDCDAAGRLALACVLVDLGTVLAGYAFRVVNGLQEFVVGTTPVQVVASNSPAGIPRLRSDIGKDFTRARMTSGDVLSLSTTRAYGANGASRIVEASGLSTGFMIPIGASGQDSYVLPFTSFAVAQAQALEGRAIVVVGEFEATENFLVGLPYTNAAAYVIRHTGEQLINQGERLYTVQDGTRLLIASRYTMQGDESSVGVVMQLNGAANPTAAKSITVKAISWTVEDSGEVRAVSYNDLPRLIASTDDAPPLRSAELIGEIRPFGELNNGGLFIVNDGLNVGISVPAGATGTSSYLIPYFTFTSLHRKLLTGRTLRLRGEMEFSNFFQGNAPVQLGNVPRAITVSDSHVPRGSFVSVKFDGTRAVLEWEYTVIGDEEQIGPLYQLLIGRAVQATEARAEFTSLTWYPLDDKGRPDNALMSSFLVAQASEADLPCLSPVYRDLLPLPQYFSGATPVLDAQGRKMGFAVPAGQTGNITLLQQQWPLYGQGARLTDRYLIVKYVYDTNEEFGRLVTPHMQVTRNGGDVGLGITLLERTVVGTKRILRFRTGPLTGEETALKPFIQIPAQTYAHDDQLLITDLSISVEGATAQETQDFSLARNTAKAERDSSVGLAAWEAVVPAPEAFNGATLLLDSLGRQNGFSIPIGQTGFTSYVLERLDLDQLAGRLNGVRLEFTFRFDESASFTRQLVPHLQLVRGSSNIDVTVVTTERSPGVLRFETALPLEGTESALRPFIQSASGSVVTAVESLVMTGLSVTPLLTNDQVGELTALRSSLSLAPVWLDCVPEPEFFSGAFAEVDSLGRRNGFQVPAGSTGYTTYVLHRWDLFGLGKQLAGKSLEVTYRYHTSAPFTRVLEAKFQVIRNGAFIGLTPQAVEYLPGLIRFRTPVLAGDETGLRPYIQIVGGVAAAVNEALVFDDLDIRVIAVTDSWSMDFSTARATAKAKQEGNSEMAPGYSVDYSIKPDGSGDFTTYVDGFLAVAAAGNPGPYNRFETVLYGDVIETNPARTNLTVPTHCDARSVGFERRHLEFHQPANTAIGTIESNSGVYVSRDAKSYNKYSNVKLTAQNMRYPYHRDVGNAAPNSRLIFEDCHVEHYGNDEARAWQAANGGSPGLVWTSEHAHGWGAASGQTLELIRTTSIGSDALYCHDNVNFAAPVRIYAEASPLIARGPHSVWLQPLGSMQRNVCQLVNCPMNGDILIDTTPWLPSNIESQPSMRQQWDVIVQGNTPAAVDWVDNSLALVIRSASTGAGSSVSASGSAATALLGDYVIELGDGNGLAGQITGALNVGTGLVGPGLDITRLGQRLGDCTTVTKTLSVVVDGGAPITITFSQNYLGDSNTSIMNAINAALGAAGTATFRNRMGDNQPRFTDLDIYVFNTDDKAIRPGYGAKFDGSHRNAKVMTSADAVADFAGVAVYTILPGKGGWLRGAGSYVGPNRQLAWSGAAPALVRGDTVGIDPAAPGKFVKGAAVALLKALDALTLELT